MAEDAKPIPEKKKGRSKKMIVASVAIVALIGAGAAGGVFVTGGFENGPTEDPNRPKLVERKAEAAPVSEEAGGKMLPKEGTISVKTDRDPVRKAKVLPNPELQRTGCARR